MAQLGAPAVQQAQAVATTSAVADPYTIVGIAIDMPVASAQEARDTALLAAERQALVKLREQLAASGATAPLPEPNEAQLARMVQNFEVAGERLSARRYSGIFTIKFRPNAVAHVTTAETPIAETAVPMSRLPVLYRFTSLSQWTALQQRLATSGVVRSVDLQAMGRGYVRATIVYNGKLDGLNNALAAQSLRLQQESGGWMLTGSEGF